MLHLGGRTETGMTTLIIVFRKCASASKHWIISQCRRTQAHSTTTFQNYTIFRHALLLKSTGTPNIKVRTPQRLPMCSARPSCSPHDKCLTITYWSAL